MKHANNILRIQRLLSLPHERNRKCEEHVKGLALWRGSLRSPLTEPSQFQSGSERRKSKCHNLHSNGVNMCPPYQPSDPEYSSPESVAQGFDAELPAWLTAAEAAQYLNVKVRTMLLWARQGRVKAYALSGTQRRVWRFLHADLEAMVTPKKPVVSSAQPSVLVNERSI